MSSAELRVDNVDLGPNTVGTFAPTPGLPDEMLNTALSDIGDQKYSKTASRRWICVDGRLTQSQIDDGLEHGVETADPAIPGGIVVSETGAVYMRDLTSHKPRSQVTADVTRDAVEDDLTVVVHGDNVRAEAGCRANVDLRGALRFAAENADIIAPLSWTLLGALNLQSKTSQDDISQAIINGKQAADNDGLWDVTASEVAAIAVDNGAEYEELVGSHVEVVERVDVTTQAFDKVGFMHDHSNDEYIVNALSASLGAYAAECFRRAELRGETERDAAMQVLRVTSLSVAMSKMLMHEDTAVVLVSEA